MSYRGDREWSDRYIPTISRIIGPLMLGPSDFERDATQATDLVMLHARDLNIACRVRRPGYAEKYPWEFTIRDHRDSGASTEFEKVVSGHGDWFFYGHAAGAGSEISRWFLVSLAAFRAHFALNQGMLRTGRTPNGDGTWFRWFDVQSFPPSPPLLIASSATDGPRTPGLGDELDEFIGNGKGKA